MSTFKSKALATAAAAVMIAGTGVAAAGTAHAATPSCAMNCLNGYSHEFGKAFLGDVYKRTAVVGAPIILFQKSNEDPAEDFDFSLDGTVNQFLLAGLVSPALALRYGSDFAFELQYSPYGADTGLCIGLASAAVQNEKVTLQPCGVSSKTVWVTDFSGQDYILNHSIALINGSDTAFSHPFVLSFPASGYPTDVPRPQLDVERLSGFAAGPALTRQQWSAFTGPVS